MTTVSCTTFHFAAAYLSVRIEPLSDIGQTGGEKKNRSTIALCYYRAAVRCNLLIQTFALNKRVKRPGGSHEGGRKKYCV